MPAASKRLPRVVAPGVDELPLADRAPAGDALRLDGRAPELRVLDGRDPDGREPDIPDSGLPTPTGGGQAFSLAFRAADQGEAGSQLRRALPRRLPLGSDPFDPGRRGVRALAVAVALAVTVAAVLAWFARPRSEPVAAPDVPLSAPPAPGSGAVPVATPGGTGAVPAAASGELVVAVTGKVRRPGLVRLRAGARVADAVEAAGGMLPGADIAYLNVARKVVDGELILVGVTAPPGAGVPVPEQAAGGVAAPGAGPPGAPVNLNTATPAQLDALPGVGPVLAQRIVDHRERHGAFRNVGDLRQVSGIGKARYEQLKDLVTV